MNLARYARIRFGVGIEFLEMARSYNIYLYFVARLMLE